MSAGVIASQAIISMAASWWVQGELHTAALRVHLCQLNLPVEVILELQLRVCTISVV